MQIPGWADYSVAMKNRKKIDWPISTKHSREVWKKIPSILFLQHSRCWMKRFHLHLYLKWNRIVDVNIKSSLSGHFLPLQLKNECLVYEQLQIFHSNCRHVCLTALDIRCFWKQVIVMQSSCCTSFLVIAHAFKAECMSSYCYHIYLSVR